MQEFTIAAPVIGLMAVLLYVTIRATVNMHGDTGKVTSGIAGALGELDRIVRPSVENIVEAKVAADYNEDAKGGD